MSYALRHRDRAHVAETATAPAPAHDNVSAKLAEVQSVGANAAAVAQILQTASPREREEILHWLHQHLGNQFVQQVLGQTKDVKLAASALLAATDRWGTNEKQVYAAIKGKSAAEITAIKEAFKQHSGGKDLDRVLAEEMKGTELKEAQALMSGDKVQIAVAQLHNAADGLGTDKQKINDTLQGITDPALRREVMAAYKRRTGVELDAMLDDELSRGSLELAKAYKKGDQGEILAVKADQALDDGGRKGHEQLYAALEACKDDGERQALIRAYQARTGRDLAADVNGLKGKAKDVGQFLLAGDKVSAEAAKMAGAAEGRGTDRKAIYAALEKSGDDQAAREAIVARYNELYGKQQTFDQMLHSELDDLDYEKAKQLESHGKMDDGFALYYAMNEGFLGIGTNDNLLKDRLTNKSKAEVAELKRQYAAAASKHGGKANADLLNDIGGETSGRAGHELDQMMKGKPVTLDEARQRAREDYEFERSGASRITDLWSGSGKRLDQTHAEIEAKYEAIKADPRFMDYPVGSPERAAMDKAMLADLQGGLDWQQGDLKAFQEAKDTTADVAGSAVTLSVGAAITLATGGATAPAFVALMSGLTGLGTTMTIKGDSMSNEDVAYGLAAVVAEASSLGIAKIGKVEMLVTKLSKLTGGNQKLLARVTREALEEAVESGSEQFIDAALDPALYTGDLATWASGIGSMTGGAAGKGSLAAAFSIGTIDMLPGARGVRGRMLKGAAGQMVGTGVTSAIDSSTYEGSQEDKFARFARREVESGFRGARDALGGGGGHPDYPDVDIGARGRGHAPVDIDSDVALDADLDAGTRAAPTEVGLDTDTGSDHTDSTHDPGVVRLARRGHRPSRFRRRATPDMPAFIEAIDRRIADADARGSAVDPDAHADALWSAVDPDAHADARRSVADGALHGIRHDEAATDLLSGKHRVVTASSTDDSSIAFEGALGPEGFFGPAGTFGPLGEHGPIGAMGNLIASGNSEGLQKYLASLGGPGSVLGPDGPFGPSSRLADSLGNMLGMGSLGVGGRYTNLGNHGVLGAEGVLGGGGPGGYHGYKLTDRGYVDQHGNIMRTYRGGDGQDHELTEMYSADRAKAMSFSAVDPANRPDASMFVVGDIQRDGESDRFPIENTSDQPQAVTVQIVPRWSRHSQAEGESIAGAAALTGANPFFRHAALSGAGMDIENSFDNFDLYFTDEAGKVIASSTASRRPDWGQINLPSKGRIYALVKLKTKGRESGAAREHSGPAPYFLSVTPSRRDMNEQPSEPFHQPLARAGGLASLHLEHGTHDLEPRLEDEGDDVDANGKNYADEALRATSKTASLAPRGKSYAKGSAPKDLLDGTHELTEVEKQGFADAISTEQVARAGGKLPTFKNEVGGQTYEQRLEAVASKLIDDQLKWAKKDAAARSAGHLYEWGDIDKVAQQSAAAVDAIFGKYARGNPLRGTGPDANIKDARETKDKQLAADPSLGDGWAEWRVEKLLTGSKMVKQLDKEYGAIQTRATEKAIIDQVRAKLATSRKDDLILIHKEWPAYASGSDIFIQRTQERDSAGKIDNAKGRDYMWKQFQTIIHEYIHTLEHEDHVKYRGGLGQKKGGFTLREGVTDYFTKVVYNNTVKTAALRKAVEGPYYEPGVTHEVDKLTTYGESENAERAADIVGFDNMAAAFFLGHTDLIGG